MARKGAIGVVEECRDIKAMPDGTPMPAPLRHTLIVLASYAPKVWPSADSLALALGVDRRTVSRRLKLLIDAGLISRTRRGWKSSQYGILLTTIRKCDIGVPVERIKQDTGVPDNGTSWESYEVTTLEEGETDENESGSPFDDEEYPF